jgi:hypothetical protein
MQPATNDEIDDHTSAWRAVAAAMGQVLFRLGAGDRIGLLDFLNPRCAFRAGEG